MLSRCDKHSKQINRNMIAFSILTSSLFSNKIFASIVGISLWGCAILARKYYAWYTSPLRKIPGSPPLKSFLLGYMLDIVREPFMDPHKRWINNYKKKHDGKTPPFIAYNTLFGKYSICVLDPDIVRIVLMEPASRDPVRFVKNYVFLKEIIGLGLVTLEGSAWSRHRRLLQPSFSNMNFLKDAINVSANKHTGVLIAAWRKKIQVQSNHSIDVASHMSAITLDVIGDVAFSHEFGATNMLKSWSEQDGSDSELNSSMDPLIQSMQESMKIRLSVVIQSFTNLSWIEKYINPKYARTRALLNERVDALVDKARTENEAAIAAKTSKEHDVKAKSLLQQLFDATDNETTEKCDTGSGSRSNKLSSLELRDEVKTFIVAGHETTSTWCYWAMYALAKYPTIQQTLYDNIEQHMRNKASTSSISVDDVESMEYLNAFMTEVLRLYSPVAIIFRSTTQEETWHGYEIPKGTRVILPIHLLNRHSDYFTEADEFIPERWLDKQQLKSIHKFCFIPFSAGVRNCIGQRFAELEAKIIVANICRSFVIRLAPCMDGKEIMFTSFVSMKSKPSIKIQAIDRY